MHEFVTEYVVPSITSDTCHVVKRDNDEYWCSCKGFEYRGTCHHIVEVQRDRLQAQIQMMQASSVHVSQSYFETLERYVEYLDNVYDQESELIVDIIMDLLRSNGNVTSDDVYTALGGNFVNGNYRKLGGIFAGLAAKKLISPIGYVKSQRGINHSRRLTVWKKAEGEDIRGDIQQGSRNDV
jgi:hypothetical protein